MTMKLFKITDLNVLEPLTVLAESRDAAADYFVAAMQRGFGQVPVIEYAVTRWNPRDLERRADLRGVLDNVRSGFVWEGQQGWEIINPFDVGSRRVP
ncbi:hypothetical protein [Novosphingobium sp. MBES04]|uniref:hypothetical protein n=1 Tax=Novosphingobium sp. MBES04 TaxID=1206458 RepID=UPI00057FAFAE|nr:hypothetical protein [Novosphingobium sp. MBES04]GAM07060.1 hypothetical protein MBENS4_4056 [Novosphingobium sp. MBES04]